VNQNTCSIATLVIRNGLDVCAIRMRGISTVDLKCSSNVTFCSFYNSHGFPAWTCPTILFCFIVCKAVGKYLSYRHATAFIYLNMITQQMLTLRQYKTLMFEL
jgi:hypothetical protein